MPRVRVERRFAAPPETVRSLIEQNQDGLLRASGFESIERDDDRLEVSRRLGFATLSLTLEMDHDADAVVAFEAVDGIFERMRTEYTVEPAGSGTVVRAWTDFTLGGVAGSALDAPLVSRQRRREFEKQFDFLEERLAAGDGR